MINGQNSTTVDIAYWTFYPYNNGISVCIASLGCIGAYSSFSNHIGDWEHIVIRFIDGYATKIYYS
jgi:hypothetical protein